MNPNHKPYQVYNLKEKKENGNILTQHLPFGIIVLINSISTVTAYFVPILMISLLILLIYLLATAPKRARIKAKQTIIQTFNEQLTATYQKLIEMEDDYQNQRLVQMAATGRQGLENISLIRHSLQLQQANLSDDFYEHVVTSTNELENDIKSYFQLTGFSPQKVLAKEEEPIINFAPEIINTYRQIISDHQHYVAKLTDSELPNKSELLALHDTEMKRFEDILKGYIAMKQSPKDFYDVDSRLLKAKKSLKEFDLKLDNDLRHINEELLHDFDISLHLQDNK